MAKVLVVTSGKGGVGKTTSTAALGAALAQLGEKVVVVDFDVGLRNLDLVLGAERRVVFDLINVVQGVAKLSQALIRDKRLENLWLLPASQTRDKDALTDEGVRSIIAELRTKFDWIPCDPAARHHSREPGRSSRVKRWIAGYAEQRRERAGARLHRRGASPDGRNGHHDGAGRAQRLDEPVTGTEGRMINLLRLIGGRTASAPVARERLQILLAHERGLRGQPELLERLRAEILAAVARHVVLDPEKVVVRMERGKQVSTLEVDIEVPNGFERSLAAAS